MSILIAAGCSWTHGQYTESPGTPIGQVFMERYNRSWPVRYGSIAGYKRVINLGDPGASIDKAIDNIVQSVTALRASSNETADVFLMLTDFRRREFAFEYKGTNYWYYFIPSSTGEAGGIRKHYAVDNRCDFLEVFDKQINDELREYLLDITANFSVFCAGSSAPTLKEQIGRKLKMLDVFCSHNKCRLYVLSAFDNIKFAGINCVNTSFMKFLQSRNYKIGTSDHPSVAQHIEFAEFVFERIRDQ